MSSLSRRNFLKLATVAGGGTIVYPATVPQSALNITQSTVREYHGSDLSEWEVVVGDGVYTAPGELSANTDDIETEHFGDHSELRANVQRRRIMAHNITFKRFIDDQALQFIHTCGYKFSLPYLPSTTNSDLNAQTLEGGIFIWDGNQTRLDYGIAFQWILNPWDDNFGGVQTWTDIDGGQWVQVGHLTPDTEWHEIRLVVDFRKEATALLIDGNHYLTRFTKTPKSETWGTEIAARLQAEIISLYPGEQGDGALHKASFKDWTWAWEPCGSC